MQVRACSHGLVDGSRFPGVVAYHFVQPRMHYDPPVLVEPLRYYRPAFVLGDAVSHGALAYGCAAPFPVKVSSYW